MAHEPAGGERVPLWRDAAGLVPAAVRAAERADAEALAQVHLARERRGARVVPVRVVGGELLVRSRLDDVDPRRELDLFFVVVVVVVGVGLERGKKEAKEREKGESARREREKKKREAAAAAARAKKRRKISSSSVISTDGERGDSFSHVQIADHVVTDRTRKSKKRIEEHKSCASPGREN